MVLRHQHVCFPSPPSTSPRGLSIRPHNTPERWGVSLFYRWGTPDSERMSANLLPNGCDGDAAFALPPLQVATNHLRGLETRPRP